MGVNGDGGKWGQPPINCGMRRVFVKCSACHVSVTACFVPQTFVSVGSEVVDPQYQVIGGGGGSVWPTGGDIDCVAPDYITLSFQATAFPDHRFLRWAGDVSGSNPTSRALDRPVLRRYCRFRTNPRP